MTLWVLASTILTPKAHRRVEKMSILNNPGIGIDVKCVVGNHPLTTVPDIDYYLDPIITGNDLAGRSLQSVLGVF